jgi:hypothetical protein
MNSKTSPIIIASFAYPTTVGLLSVQQNTVVARKTFTTQAFFLVIRIFFCCFFIVSAYGVL